METSAVVANYLRHIDATPRLERDAEMDLIVRARSNEPGAQDELLRSHLAFVIRVAMEFRNRGVPFEDLINEGCVGLLKAIRRFEPDHGARFMTYAAFWIRKALLDALAAQPRVVHVPRYQRSLGKPIAKEARLDDVQSWEGSRSIAEQLVDTKTPEPANAFIERETIGRLRRHLFALSPREQAVLASRFGLLGDAPRTLKDVGIDLAISRERVRQIESAALARLRFALRKDQASLGLRFAPNHT
jgi:RNA polymerase primary sigma factor